MSLLAEILGSYHQAGQDPVLPHKLPPPAFEGHKSRAEVPAESSITLRRVAVCPGADEVPPREPQLPRL